MENKYLDSGALFANDRKQNLKAPEWKGEIEISPELLKKLAMELKSGNPTKISLAGWNKVSKNGNTFISIKASPPYVPQQAQSTQNGKESWEQ
jgi:hypothetical protein